jgi:hypothetical protein
LELGIATIMTYAVATAPTAASTPMGRSSRYGLTPQARSATDSRSLDIRPRPMRMPTSSAIGMVSPRAWGTSSQRMWAAVLHVMPLARRFSSWSIIGGRTRRNVKIKSARRTGGRISRST